MAFTSIHSDLHTLEIYSSDTNYSRRGHSLRKLLEDAEIKELPVQISANCTLEELHQSVQFSGIICINESRLWSEVTERGVKINHLSELQAKTAIVSAALEELKARQMRAKEQIRQQVISQRRNQPGSNIFSRVSSQNTLNAHQHDTILFESSESPSFYEHVVASFLKEAKNKPSDFAIPHLDAFYERHLPVEKPSEDVDDFDGLLPDDMKPKKKVKRPFFPVVVDEYHYDGRPGDWGNPLSNQWKHSNIPGIPRMPVRPPVNVLPTAAKVPNVHVPPQNQPKRWSGIPEMPTYIPNMPETPQSVTQVPNMPPTLPNVIEPPNVPTVGEYHQPPSLLTSEPQVVNPVSGSNKTKRSKSVTSLSDDLLQLRSFKLQAKSDLVMRKLPTRFKYNGIRIKDRLKYIERAVNATDPVLKDVVELSLNPDILERAKVGESVHVHILSVNKILLKYWREFNLAARSPYV